MKYIKSFVLFENFDTLDPNGLYTYEELNAAYPHKQYYVGYLEVDSFDKGKTTPYMVVHKKTGEKNKYGGSIYEPELLYYALSEITEDGVSKYKKANDPWEKLKK